MTEFVEGKCFVALVSDFRSNSLTKLISQVIKKKVLNHNSVGVESNLFC